jgi:hypothetical protein
MSGNKYYDFASDNDVNEDASYGSDCESSSSEDECRSVVASGQDPLWGRTIVHLDIDCFYVQAEEIERGLRNMGRPIPPLAIGQKHIIVSECGNQN